jgi:hypothetical protein
MGGGAVGIIGLLRMFLFGSEAVRRRDIYLVRTWVSQPGSWS